MRQRSNAEWIVALNGRGDEQAAALTDLRTYLLRAALFTLQRALPTSVISNRAHSVSWRRIARKRR